jgi:hypothetical protein
MDPYTNNDNTHLLYLQDNAYTFGAFTPVLLAVLLALYTMVAQKRPPVWAVLGLPIALVVLSVASIGFAALSLDMAKVMVRSHYTGALIVSSGIYLFAATSGYVVEQAIAKRKEKQAAQPLTRRGRV